MVCSMSAKQELNQLPCMQIAYMEKVIQSLQEVCLACMCISSW